MHFIGEQRQLRVRDPPFSPARLGLPRSLAEADPLVGHGIPIAAVLGHVFGQVFAHVVSVGSLASVHACAVGVRW